MKNKVKLIIISLLFVSCAKTMVDVLYQNPNFNINEIKNKNLMISVSKNIEVLEYKDAFAKLFPNSDSCWRYVSKTFFDSIKSVYPKKIIQEGPPQFPNTSHIDDFEVESKGRMNNNEISEILDSIYKVTGIKYFIYIPDITVNKVYTESVIGGPDRDENCEVSITVEIWDTAKRQRKMTFHSLSRIKTIGTFINAPIKNAINGSVYSIQIYLKSK